MSRLLPFLNTRLLSRCLHNYGYSAVSTSSMVRSTFKSYQNYMGSYLKQYTSEEIRQQLNNDSNQSMRLAINNGRNDYSQGKSVLVYKPNSQATETENSLVSATAEIYNILHQIALEMYGSLCELQPQLKPFVTSHDCTHSTQDESIFFANNQVNSLTIYRYLSVNQYGHNTKACTSHFDSDLLTMILLSDDINGLEYASSIDQNGEVAWEEIKYENFMNADLIVFGGALLQTLSQSKYPALIHRVQIQKRPRISTVFKLKANQDLVISTGKHGHSKAMPTQILSPILPYKDNMRVSEFMENIGSWNSIQRQSIMHQYLDSDELIA